MTQDEIAALMEMGSTEEEIAELLRQQERQEGIIDSTRSTPTTLDAGRGNVIANYQPIADMFIRGQAEKRIKQGEGDVANKRASLNERTRQYYNAATGRGLGGIDLRSDVSVKAPSLDVPQMAQVTPPPASPAPAPTPGPQPAPGASPAPTPPASVLAASPNGKDASMMTEAPFAVPNMTSQGGPLAGLLAQLLRRG